MIIIIIIISINLHEKGNYIHYNPKYF
jgi:hypothetical protein